MLAHCCEWRGGTIIALHNLSREPAVVQIDLTQYECDHLIDLLLLTELGEQEEHVEQRSTARPARD